MSVSVRAFIAVYPAVGFLIVFGLVAFLVVMSVRRHGFRNAFRSAVRGFVEELPLYWRVPVVAWMFVIVLPLIAAWAIVTGEWDPVGVIFLVLLWLLYFALLRWHSRAKARARNVERQPNRRPNRHRQVG